MRRKVLIMSRHLPHSYSGGRYHSWIMTEALAFAGYEVTVWTDHNPFYARDFQSHNNKIKILVDEKFSNLPLDERYDFLIVVPHHGDYENFYVKALQIYKRYKSKLILLNFESPNWFNSLSQEIKRDISWWEGCVLISQYADMILSSAKESISFARDFYSLTPPNTLFEYCYPGINSHTAGEIYEGPREKQIMCLTRFIKTDSHKGGYLVKSILTDQRMSGYTFILLIGNGPRDENYIDELIKNGERNNIELKILSNINDKEKYDELKKSQALLFLSEFEGFGYPPAEALYCGTPCVAFDLPVLREVGGNEITFVEKGDLDQIVVKLLETEHTGISKRKQMRGQVENKVRFEDYSKKLNILLSSLAQKRHESLSI